MFGSLPAGWFRPGKSGVDLFAVLASDIREGETLEALRSRHDCFVAEFPAWQERVEVGYVSQAALQTFGNVPKGQVAVVSPGEPLNVKAAGSEFSRLA